MNYDTLVVSGGIYRLLFNVKCELGVKFRKRVTVILDGMWLGEEGLARPNDAELEIGSEENSEEDSVYDFLENF